MLSPIEFFETFKDQFVIIHMRRPVKYTGKLRGFDQHLNLKIQSATENNKFIGTIILNGGSIAAIECLKNNRIQQ